VIILSIVALHFFGKPLLLKPAIKAAAAAAGSTASET
tara:strand:- start:173 stop:283 length:111 start_codon:yes stop_codon:yes gene_type:complete